MERKKTEKERKNALMNHIKGQLALRQKLLEFVFEDAKIIQYLNILKSK